MAPGKRQPYRHAAATWREQQTVAGLEEALLAGLPARDSAPCHLQVCMNEGLCVQAIKKRHAGRLEGQ